MAYMERERKSNILYYLKRIEMPDQIRDEIKLLFSEHGELKKKVKNLTWLLGQK